MGLGRLNLIRKTWQQHKNLTIMSCQQIVMSLSFSFIIANLEQSRCRFLDVWFVKPTLLLIIAFYLTETEKLSSRALALGKGTVFAKNMLIFCKNNRKIEEVSVLKDIFSETTYVCVQWTLSNSTPPNSNISLIQTNPLSP